MTEEKASLSLMLISIVLASTIVTLGGFGVFGVAHGQSNATTASSSLTEQQRAAMCDPSNPKLNFVNSTESKACGLPKSVKSNTTTAGPEVPSAAPTPPEPGS